jgi:hypothetical protein
LDDESAGCAYGLNAVLEGWNGSETLPYPDVGPGHFRSQQLGLHVVLSSNPYSLANDPMVLLRGQLDGDAPHVVFHFTKSFGDASMNELLGFTT